MKSYNQTNGWMLLLIFGTCAVVTAAPELYDHLISDRPRERGFARLIRAEDRSFFGYQRYYFTLLLKDTSDEIKVVTAVDSDLFHLRKVGDNIEVQKRAPQDLHIVGNNSHARNRARLVLSLLLTGAGALLLSALIKFRRNHE